MWDAGSKSSGRKESDDLAGQDCRLSKKIPDAMLGMIWSRSRVLCMVRKLLYRGQEAWIVVLQGLTG